MKVAKKIFKYAGNIIFALFVIVLVLIIYSKIRATKNADRIPSIFGYKFLTVLTGSMSPYMEPGDMIVVKNTSETDIEVGDVITYKKSEHMTVTHRVIEKLHKEGKVVFRTKGDANNVSDEELISHRTIIGEESFIIRYGGYIARFFSGKAGFILIFVVIFIVTALEVRDLLFKEKKFMIKKN